MLLVARLATSCETGEDFMQSGQEVVSARLRSKDDALTARLEHCPNPRGVGVVVFVRQPSGCQPFASWLYLDDETVFALDSGSHALTPELPDVSTASARTKSSTGFEPQRFEAEIREFIYQMARRRKYRNRCARRRYRLWGRSARTNGAFRPRSGYSVVKEHRLTWRVPRVRNFC